MPIPVSSVILGRAVPVLLRQNKFIRMSVYGLPKTGKTRFAATFPKPLLILGSEDGTESIRRMAGVTFLRVLARNEKADDNAVVRIDEMPFLFNELKGGTQYKTVVLDTANRLSDVNLANVMGHDRTPEKGLVKASKDQYIANSFQVKSLLSGLLSLHNVMNVVVLSHEKDFNRESDSESRTPSISASLSEAVERLLHGDMNYVCQTFIRDQVVTKMEDVLGNGKVVEVQEKTGKAEYCMRLGDHPHYVTGFRIAEGLSYPDVLPNPTYDKIRAIIQGEKVT